MEKSTVKKIFIFFLLFLPLQYAAVGIIGLEKSEPWPAFILPAFQDPGTEPRYVTVIKPVISIIDSNEKVLEEVSFSGIQASQLQGFLRSHFSDSLQWIAKGQDSKAWLTNQIKTNYPSLEPDALQMRWIKMYYNLSASKPRIDSTRVIDEFVISLDNLGLK